MIIDQTLAHWLADKDSQAKTVAAMTAFGLGLRESAPMVDLQRELAATEVPAEAVLAAGRRFLDRAGDIEAMMLAMVRAALADPFYRPPLKLVSSEVHLGLLLVDDPLLSVLLAIITPDGLAAKRMLRTGPSSISFVGRQAIFKFIKAGGATLSFWEAPEVGPEFRAETAARCRMVDRRKIEDGETILIDGRSRSFVIDHADSDIVYLQASTFVEAAPVSVEYDSSTLGFVGASSADEASSRVQMMLSLLRMLDRTDAAALFRNALAHEHFHVRWHAMREFLALDAGLALPSLRAMVQSDPHPDIRAAAKQTLQAFFPDDELSTERKSDLCLA